MEAPGSWAFAAMWRVNQWMQDDCVSPFFLCHSTFQRNTYKLETKNSWWGRAAMDVGIGLGLQNLIWVHELVI